MHILCWMKFITYKLIYCWSSSEIMKTRAQLLCINWVWTINSNIWLNASSVFLLGRLCYYLLWKNTFFLLDLANFSVFPLLSVALIYLFFYLFFFCFHWLYFFMVICLYAPLRSVIHISFISSKTDWLKFSTKILIK